MIQIRVSNNWMGVAGDGMAWSDLVPFGWYMREIWEYQYGKDWALDRCIEWFEWDGKLYNFWMDLEPQMSCPCRVDQAVIDIGRFMPKYDCDRVGNNDCYYTMGARHCVISSSAM